MQGSDRPEKAVTLTCTQGGSLPGLICLLYIMNAAHTPPSHQGTAAAQVSTCQEGCNLPLPCALPGKAHLAAQGRPVSKLAVWCFMCLLWQQVAQLSPASLLNKCATCSKGTAHVSSPKARQWVAWQSQHLPAATILSGGDVKHFTHLSAAASSPPS